MQSKGTILGQDIWLEQFWSDLRAAAFNINILRIEHIVSAIMMLEPIS